MIYEGTFKNNLDETIRVTITPSGSSSTIVPLEFTGEQPVVISQVSDGLFAPIKSRTCTVRIMSTEPLFELYSASPKGVKLVVNNDSTHYRLFEGYVTPFNYNQGYHYLDEISIEAVDAISVLKDIKYTPLKINDDQLIDVAYILKRGLIDIAGYNYRLWVPKESITSTNWPNQSSSYSKLPATLGEKISESAFKDEDGEYISWYEIIEEICRFYCFSCVPSDDGIYFIDYKLCRYYDLNNPNSETIHGVVNPFRTLIDIAALTFSISNDVYQGISFPASTQEAIDESFVTKKLWIPNQGITASSYTGSEQTLEIDECYNKFTVKPSIEEFDLNINPTDNTDVAAYLKTLVQQMVVYLNGQATDEGRRAYVGLYEFHFGYNGDNNWTCGVFTNSRNAVVAYVLNDQFSMESNSITNARGRMPVNYENGTGNLNYIPGQTIMPCRYFTASTSSSTVPDSFYPAKAKWNDILVIPTGAYYLYKYYNTQNILYSPEDGSLYIGNPDWPDYLTWVKPRNWPAMGMRGWYTDFYENHFGGNNVLLTYTSDEFLDYAPHSTNTNGDLKSYLIIKGDILYQEEATQDNTTYKLWSVDGDNINGVLYPMSELGWSGDIDITNYQGDARDYEVNAVLPNTYFKETNGWPFIKMSVQIGNYYWNGSAWTTTDSTFFMDVCKLDGNNQKLVLNDWMKIQRNYTYEDCIETDNEGYAIPINKNLKGKLTVKFYMPRMPFHGQIKSWGARNTTGVSSYEAYHRQYFTMDYTKCPPAIFMKDFEIVHYTAKNSSYTENSKRVGFAKNFFNDKDEDIEYTQTISNSFLNEMPQIDLKFNTVNEDKPVLRPNEIVGCVGVVPFNQYTSTDRYSYTNYMDPIITFAGATPTYQRQELNILDRYVQHYSTPKKIYNCQINGYMVPMQCFEATAIPNTRFVLDEQQWDVKSDINNVKLIEY